MKRVIYIAVAVVILTAAAILIYNFTQGDFEYRKIDTTKSSTKLQEETFLDYSFTGDITIVGSKIVTLSDGYINWYSNSASFIKKSVNRLNKPIIKTKEGYLVAAESQGKKIEVYRDTDLVWSKSMEGNIVNVSINKNGYVSVIREYTGYRSAVEVYDNTGKQLFYLCKATLKLMDAQVSDKNDGVYLTMADTEGCALNTVVEYTDMSGKTKWKQTAANALLYSIKHMPNGKVVCAGKENLHIISEKENIEYTFNQINAINISSNEKIVICANSTEGEVQGNVINFYDINGKQVGGLILDSEIKKMTAIGDLMAISFGRKLIIVNDIGEIKGELETDKEIVDMDFVSTNKLLVKESDRINAVEF